MRAHLIALTIGAVLVATAPAGAQTTDDGQVGRDAR